MKELKINTEYFNEVAKGNKTFEFRKNDRNFQVGDIYRLREYDNGKYTGNYVDVQIRYVLKDFNSLIASGYCIFSFCVYKIQVRL